MSVNLDAVLWGSEGKPTVQLLATWRQRSGKALQATIPLVDLDGLGTADFRRTWQAAFPGLRPMPGEKLAERDGRATMTFWDALP